MHMASKSTSRGYLIALGATVLLSYDRHSDQLLEPDVPSSLPGAGLLAGRLRCTRSDRGLRTFQPRRFGLQRVHLGFFLLYGLTLALFNSIWTFSVEFNGAAVATVLAYSSPAMTAILAHYLLAEQIDAAKVAAIVMSMLGHCPGLGRSRSGGLAS